MIIIDDFLAWTFSLNIWGYKNSFLISFLELHQMLNKSEVIFFGGWFTYPLLNLCWC